jgi:hypothetical protein
MKILLGKHKGDLIISSYALEGDTIGSWSKCFGKQCNKGHTYNFKTMGIRKDRIDLSSYEFDKMHKLRYILNIIFF